MLRCIHDSWVLRMRSLYFALALFLILEPFKLAPQQINQTSEPIWSWFGNCRDKKYVGFQLLMNGATIHKTSFPVCPIKDLSEEDPHYKILVFFFKGGHVFQGQYHTKPTQRIEGNIWQAGGDPGVILFGVSFSAPWRHGQTLLNTIHIADAYKESSTEIDDGLIVRTFPIENKEQSD